MPTNLSYPLFRQPLVDAQGYLARPWQQFFEAMVVRVGQDRAMTNLELEADGAAMTVTLTANTAADAAQAVLQAFTPPLASRPVIDVQTLFEVPRGRSLPDIERLFDDRGLAATQAVSTLGTHSIWVPAQAMTPSTTLGATMSHLEMATNKNNVITLTFADSGGLLYAEFQMAMPSKWNEGTLTYAVYWTVNSASTNSAVFGLQAVAMSNDDPLDVAFGTAIEVTDAGLGTAYDLHVSATSAAMTVAGTPVAGDMVAFRFYRDAGDGSDTLAASVELIGIKVFWVTTASTDA